jgi:hypothetical protein
VVDKGGKQRRPVRFLIDEDLPPALARMLSALAEDVVPAAATRSIKTSDSRSFSEGRMGTSGFVRGS